MATYRGHIPEIVVCLLGPMVIKTTPYHTNRNSSDQI